MYEKNRYEEEGAASEGVRTDLARKAREVEQHGHCGQGSPALHATDAATAAEKRSWHIIDHMLRSTQTRAQDIDIIVKRAMDTMRSADADAMQAMRAIGSYGPKYLLSFINAAERQGTYAARDLRRAGKLADAMAADYAEAATRLRHVRRTAPDPGETDECQAPSALDLEALVPDVRHADGDAEELAEELRRIAAALEPLGDDDGPLSPLMEVLAAAASAAADAAEARLGGDSTSEETARLADAVAAIYAVAGQMYDLYVLGD